MIYPGYPDNRLVVGDVDLTTTFRMILLDGYQLPPAEPEFTTVDIPGKIDGPLDLTFALTGEASYQLRTQTLQFAIIDVEDFEKIKTQVFNFLHGKNFDYTMTMDPGYTYNGNFVVEECAHASFSNGLVASIQLRINANPFKSLGIRTYKLNATGGKLFRLESGRKPVYPVLECSEPCTVAWRGNEFKLGAGTYRLNDVLFKQGWNELYINSFRFWNITWNNVSELGSNPLTWEEATKYRWDDLQRLAGDIMDIPRAWADLANTRWEDIALKTWGDVDFRNEEVPDTTVYIQYEWKDL